MTQHRHSFAVGEMAMPLMETPEQQENMNLKEKLELNQIEIIELKEQLNQEKKDHQKTKSQLETAEIKLSDRASEVEGLRSIIQSFVIWDQASYKKIQQNDHFKAETESKFQMMKMEFDKKFDDFKLENDKKIDDLKEQISKGQMQEELQKLKDLNEKLESEKERLQKELSDSIMETKYLKENIEEFEKTDNKKDEKNQELEETIRQKECKLDELEKKLSDVADNFEKRYLEYEVLKKKYEEAVVKLNGMDELQLAMTDLELKHSQLQQQLDKKTEDHQSPIDGSSLSKEVQECVAAYKHSYDAWLNKSDLQSKFYEEYRKRYYDLSADDLKKCRDIVHKYREENIKKRKNSQ